MTRDAGMSVWMSVCRRVRRKWQRSSGSQDLCQYYGKVKQYCDTQSIHSSFIRTRHVPGMCVHMTCESSMWERQPCMHDSAYSSPPPARQRVWRRQDFFYVSSTGVQFLLHQHHHTIQRRVASGIRHDIIP